MASRFTLTMVDTARGNLDALLEADMNTREISVRRAIRALTPTLRKLERKGHSRQKPVELLAEQGIQINLSSLKDYLGDKGSKKPARSQQSTSAAVSPTGGPEASARPEVRPVTAPVGSGEWELREAPSVPAASDTARVVGART
jgi:hypothetical protein